MHVRESKLYTLVCSVARFMGGWGSCHTGIEKVADIEDQLVRGYQPDRLDQCNLRAWVLGDLFIALTCTLFVFTLGSLFGSFVFAPLLYWLTHGSVGKESSVVLTLSITGIMHMLLLIWSKGLPNHTWRPVKFYMGLWEKLAVYLWTKPVRVVVGAGVIGKSISTVGQGFSSVAAAGRELKEGVCVVYDRATPETKVKWATRMLLDRDDLWRDGKVMLVAGEGQNWPAQVKAGVTKWISGITDAEVHVALQIANDCNILVLSLPEALAIIANMVQVESAEQPVPMLTIMHDLDEPPQVFADISHLHGNYHDMDIRGGGKCEVQREQPYF